jgi:hypothetical protein
MSHKGIYVRLRMVLAGVIFCILAVYAMIIFHIFPRTYRTLSYDWQKIPTVLAFAALCLTAIPCVIAVVYGWRISNLVKADRSFSSDTAKLLAKISTCAFVDAAYFFVFTIAVSFVELTDISTLIVSFTVIVLAVAFGMAFAALARIVQKAADLQEESDLTV